MKTDVLKMDKNGPDEDMNAIEQQKNYYEKYWTHGHTQYSGDNQGYAANLRKWMGAELEGVARDAAILEVGCGDASFTRDLGTYSSRVTAFTRVMCSRATA